MTELALFTGGTLLKAAAADAADDRIREGILVPWDEPGRTNLGKGVKVRRAFAAGLKADAKIVGVYGHTREGVEPLTVSRVLQWEDRPEGLWGRVKIARTALGDQLLAEIDDGARDGLSIEATDLKLDAEGHIVAGDLDFFAHVPVGAYDSARAAALAAALNTPTGDPHVTAPTTAPADQAAAPAPAALDYGQLAAALAPHLTAAAVPGGLPTTSLTGLAPSAGPAADAEDPIDTAARLQAEVWRGTAAPELRAALADITNTGLDLFQSPAGALGEKLWEGAGYTRQFTSLFRQKPLTSWKFTGWQWVNRPKVAAYAGDKAPIPTNTVSVTTVEGTATRVAGGWDIDRKFVDFGDAEFWKELYAATTESYLEETDLQAAAALISYARDVTVDANVPAGYAGINIAQADVLRAVALGTAILEDTPRVRKGPDYVVMNTADWLGLVNITNLDVPAFLSLLKVAPGQFLRSSEVDPGTVVLGVKQAATFRELGSTPIRVQAQNIPQGGVDEAVFGYTGISLDRPGGIISVPLAAG